MILDKSEDHQPFDQHRDLRLEKKDILRSKCKNYGTINLSVNANYNTHSIVFYVPALERSYIEYVLSRCHCRSTVPCPAFYCTVRTEVVQYNGDFPTCNAIPPGPLSRSQMQVLVEDALFLATPIKNPNNFHPEYSFRSEYGVDPFLLSIPVQYQGHDNAAVQKLSKTIQMFASLKLPNLRTKTYIGCFLLGQCATIRGGVSLLTSRSLLLKAARQCTVKYSVKLNLAPGASTSNFASCHEHIFNPKVCLSCYVQSTQTNNPHCVNPACQSNSYQSNSYQSRSWGEARPTGGIERPDLSSPPPSSPSGSNSPNTLRTYAQSAAQSGRSIPAKARPQLTPIGNGVRTPNSSRNPPHPFFPPYLSHAQVPQPLPSEPNEKTQRNIEKLEGAVRNIRTQLSTLEDSTTNRRVFQEMYEGMERRVESLEANKETIDAFEQAGRQNQTKKRFEGLKKDLCQLIDDRNARHSTELERIHRKVLQLELKTDRAPVNCTCSRSRRSSIVDAESNQSDCQFEFESNAPESSTQTNAPKNPPLASAAESAESVPNLQLKPGK